MNIQAQLVFVLLLCGFSSCNADSDSMTPYNCPVRSMEGPYDYSPVSGKGPESWGLLKDEYALCATGQMQSPIDFPLHVNIKKKNTGPVPRLMKSEMTFFPSVMNWGFKCAGNETCGMTTYNNTMYYVKKVHFHRKSEHLLNGTQYPLEMQIIHKSMDNQTAVISVLFEFEKENDYFSKISSKARYELDKNKVIGGLFKAVHDGNTTFMVDLPALVKQDGAFCTYMGSLTTPPCSESVVFLMSTHIMKISKSQVHHYWMSTGFGFDGNNRPVQHLHRRNVTCFLKHDVPMMGQNDSMTTDTENKDDNNTAVIDF